MMNNFKIIMMLFCASILFVSCSDDDDSNVEHNAVNKDKEIVNVLAKINKAYYLAYVDDIESGTLSFVNNGTQLDADQAAKVVAAGGYIYSLNYGSGILSQLEANKDGSYTTLKEINVGLSVGTTRPRFKVADDNTLMVYNVATTATYNDDNSIKDFDCVLRLASLKLPSLVIENLTEFSIPQSDNAKLGAIIGYHPMRVDAPVIAGGKIYFGLMHSDISDPSVPPYALTPKQSGVETLVFDYPSFKNGTLTTSLTATGHTGGYRAPSMHVDEKGDVYQSNWYMTGNKFDLSGGDKTVLKRLRDGQYDETYDFDVSTALGLTTNIGTAGWFYVGNGIGYMPIHLESEGSYYKANSWTLAKVDLYNKTAEQLAVPNSNLFSYQNGIVKNGKFYMAISPTGENASSYVYEFDPVSNTIKKGLELDGDNVVIEGIY